MEIRKIAVFHNTAGVTSAWGCAEGLVTTLLKQGYEVANLGHPQYAQVSIEALAGMDLILMGAPEWYDHVLFARYGQAWIDLKVPKVAWYAESAYRDDRCFDFRRCRLLADLHYYPAVQDAEEFGGAWLPFGVDPLIFFPAPAEKRYEAAFLGNMYPKRVEYIRATGFPIAVMPPTHDPNPVRSALLLGEAYRSTNIFVNLPAYSRLLVTKITEVMACRTMLVTPSIDHPSGVRNMAQFENGKHLVYYDRDNPAELARVLDYYARRPAERDAMARAGWEEIMRGHTMQHRLQGILDDARQLVLQKQQGLAHFGA